MLSFSMNNWVGLSKKGIDEQDTKRDTVEVVCLKKKQEECIFVLFELLNHTVVYWKDIE